MFDIFEVGIESQIHEMPKIIKKKTTYIRREV